MADPISSETVVGTLVGAVFGFLSSVAVFRSRFTAIEKDVAALEKTFKIELDNFQRNAVAEWARIRDEVRRNCDGDHDYRERSERREKEMLLILGDIANRLHAARRVSDLGQYIEHDDSPEHEGRRDRN